MELAPRDIVSRCIQTEIDQGRGFDHPLGRYIQLDLRHLGEKKIIERLPGIRTICIDFIGIDPVKEPIPIMPCQHYSMGGIDVDETGASEIAGFYAAGECACVSVHGANRLGGNSLLDTIVFGKLAALAIDQRLSASEITQQEKPLLQLSQKVSEKIGRLTRRVGEKTYQLAADLGAVMSEKVGIFRTKVELIEAFKEITRIRDRYQRVSVSSADRHMNYELYQALELEYMLEVARVITLGALLREESRGAHYRRDFPTRNDAQWLKHTIARIDADQEPAISYKKVVITRYPPMERTY
jgi:succinate dehydrogenase / fumarate reductase flavoprotein subunit